MPVSNKEKCICQICICGEHRCESLKACEVNESHSKTESKALTESQLESKQRISREENNSSELKEKSRKQWETSPDQMKEISRSLSQINGTNLDKADSELIRSKRLANEKLTESQANRSTLPPINTFSDSDSGKEPLNSCICDAMYKSNTDLRTLDNLAEANQWVVSRPIRNRPKDNLHLLEGPMEMETTFKTTYDSTAKQINDNLSSNVAVVMPSTKVGLDEKQLQELKQSNGHQNAVKASKKRVKQRPSTSLKAGGDGDFNTINKECYKNFVIIDDNSRVEKAKSGSNLKKSSVCCSTVANIKLPKVDTNNREDKQNKRRMSREEKATQIEQMNRSMQNMTTNDKLESTQRTHTNSRFIESSSQTNGIIENNSIQNDNKVKTKEKKSVHHKREESQQRITNESQEVTNSWTVESLEDHKRMMTRDVDNIQELGLLDEPNEQIIHEIQTIQTQQQENDKPIKAIAIQENTMESEKTNGSNRVRIESKHYVQSQRRQKKHKNESSMRLFSGDMDFKTTTNTFFADKSPNRADGNTKAPVREHTAGKKSRKSGRKGNLFRTSTEAEFNEPYGEKSDTTYHQQYSDRLYCPVLDLMPGRKSEFVYRGEASGHKFFLPAVKY